MTLSSLHPTSLAALVILALTYAGIALGRIPGLRLDRAGIALLGGAAMIAIRPPAASTTPSPRSTSTPSRSCSA